MFGAYAAPSLMNQMGSQESVTVLLEGAVLVQDADAILRHRESLDEFDSSGNEKKRTSMEVDLLMDDTLSFKGLPDDFTNAVVVIDGERWSVERIVNGTETFQRIRVVRVEPRGRNRSGFYRGS